MKSYRFFGAEAFIILFCLLQVWDAKTLTLKHTVSGLHHWVRALALNPERVSNSYVLYRTKEESVYTPGIRSMGVGYTVFRLSITL